MSAQDKTIPVLGQAPLGSLTLTGTNETARAISPSGLLVALLQRGKLTAAQGPAEQWLPLSFSYIITTGITVTAAVVQLWKNGVAPNGPSATNALNGTATLPIAALGANEIHVALSDYTYAAAPAAADVWSLKVLTTSTAGIVNPIKLFYATYPVIAITDGVTL